MGCTPGQQRCIDTLSGALVVSAGAGSGKTFTLTRRIVNSLESGFVGDVSEILAITFTSKAAGEIKSRVKGALRAAGMADQALKVDSAWISTIHGMCSRILRENALELGIDPMFSVLDEAASAPLMDASIEEVLGGSDGARGRFDALFGEFKVRSAGPGDNSTVDGMVRVLAGRIAADPQGGAGLRLLVEDAPSPVKVAAAASESAHAALALACGQKEGAKRDEFVSATEEALGKLDACLDEGGISAPNLAQLLSELPVPPRSFGSKEFKDSMAQLRSEYAESMLEARLLLAEPAACELVEMAQAVAKAYARRKRDLGVLDNDDLLVMAARAFAQHPAIEQRYATRFKLVMVDEFQDTDQQQVDMVRHLAGSDCERLCTVGDAQQSIYRFRGADVSVYNRHLAYVQAKGEDGVIVLPHNFRSHADVLAFVDRVFEQPDVFGRSFMSLTAARDESRVPVPFAGMGPRIEVQLTTRPSRGVTSLEAACAGAQRIAESFARLRDAGHSAGDMVVLLGSMTRSQVYADALRDAGFACVVAGGSVFNRAPEVAMMVDAAAALANPGDTEALFGVLSSEMFTLSADDMVVLATVRDSRTGALRRRSLDDGMRAVAAMLREGLDSQPALACAVRAYARAQDVAARKGLAAGLDSLVLDSGLLSRLESQQAEGRARAANVLKAIRMARDAEEKSAAGLASAAKEFALRVSLAKEAPGALSARGGDFVRIMTVHASKGLEFPIVAAAELRDGGGRASKLVATSVDGMTLASVDAGRTAEKMSSKMMDLASGLSLFDEYSDEQLEEVLRHPGSRARLRSAIREREARGEAGEAYRLLYVALTRAKEALVVSLSGKRTKDDPAGCSGAVAAAVAHALFGPEGVIPEGTSQVGFGGTSPALVCRVDLEAAPSEADAGAVQDDSPQEAFDAASVEVFAARGMDRARLAAYRPATDGVFSYSSISAGAVPFEGDGASDAAADGEGETEAGASVLSKITAAAFDEEEEAVWMRAKAFLSDPDKATDLGTAFHRLAQRAVLARPDSPGAPLVRPEGAALDGLCRRCGLSGHGRQRLVAALDLWFASEEARRMAQHRFVWAEVPFFVAVPGASEELFMEGEIDLLAFDGEDPRGQVAHVVDYKTGGHAGQSAEELHAKHLLQAQCYAFAVLARGFSRVELCFARVERPCAPDGGMRESSVLPQDGPMEPEYVRYAFDGKDRGALAAAIVDAYRRSR